MAGGERGRPRHPTALLELGERHHKSKEWLEERKAAELDVTGLGDAFATPDYLTDEQAREYERVVAILLKINELAGQDIYTDADIDVVARYAIEWTLYKRFTRALATCEDEEIRQLQLAADKAFQHVTRCASDLGLTVTSRAKIQLPQGVTEDDELF